jgi:hypothetical protein
MRLCKHTIVDEITKLDTFPSLNKVESNKAMSVNKYRPQVIRLYKEACGINQIFGRDWMTHTPLTPGAASPTWAGPSRSYVRHILSRSLSEQSHSHETLVSTSMEKLDTLSKVRVILPHQSGVIECLRPENISSVSIENRNLTDPKDIEKALAFGEYIKKGKVNRTNHPFNRTHPFLLPHRNTCDVLIEEV